MESFIDFVKIIGISILVGVVVVLIVAFLAFGITSAVSNDSYAGTPLELVYSSSIYAIYADVETGVCYIRSSGRFETMVDADGSPKLYEKAIK